MPLDVSLVQVSFVVLAGGLDPSFLHPAILAGEDIVPCDWHADEHLIASPTTSRVAYSADGVVLQASADKMDVTVHDPLLGGSPSIVEIGGKLVAAHDAYRRERGAVEYRGLGVNYVGFITRPDGQAYSKGWLNAAALGPPPDATLESVGVTMVYQLATMRLRLSVDSGRIMRPDESEERDGVLITANYHADIDSLAELSREMDREPEHRNHFSRLVDTLLAPRLEGEA